MTLLVLSPYPEDMEFHQVNKIWCKQVKNTCLPAGKAEGEAEHKPDSFPSTIEVLTRS